MPVTSTGEAQYQNTSVNVKVVLSALWVAMLFVFAYVDMFGFFRADVLNAALEGEVGSTGLAVNQVFLTATLIYILIPSLMVVLSLVFTPRANRITNITVSLLYTATILGSCIGETWAYYLIGSAAEAVLLLAIARTAWKWPRR
ncbi:MAG: DUF6326 family protein [Actinomycetota bacterium]|nr:DUF6326 family protein [Actinomycetota bacterium]